MKQEGDVLQRKVLDEFHKITHLEEINIINKNFNFPLNQVISVVQYNFEINIGDAVVIDKLHKSILKTIEVTINGREKDQEHTLATIKIIYTFRLENIELFVSNIGNS